MFDLRLVINRIMAQLLEAKYANQLMDLSSILGNLEQSRDDVRRQKEVSGMLNT